MRLVDGVRSMRRIAVLIVGIFATLAGGCGKTADVSAPGSREKAKTPSLGAVLPMFSHPFFVAQQKGLKDEAARQGVEIDVRDGQDDDQKQIIQVETLINLKVDALILCPRDENALLTAVESANRANIPVVTMNRRVNGGKVVCYVGADDAQGGKAQGEALVAALGPKGGKIIYLQGTPGSSPQVSRQKGFMAVLKDHPEIEIASDQFANFQEDKAKAVMTGLVRRFQPGEIRAIVAQADEMALPAAEVARAEGWKDVTVIGFNGTKDAFDAIKSGLIYATVLQNAAEQGELAVRAAVDHLRGKPVSGDIFTPLPVVTRSNVDTLKPSY